MSRLPLPGNAEQKPGGRAEALAPQRIRIGGTVVDGQCLRYLRAGLPGDASSAGLLMLASIAAGMA